MRPTKNRLRVWRKPGQRLNQRYIVPTFKSGYQVVSVWGGLSIKGRTPLVGTFETFDRNPIVWLLTTIFYHLCTIITTDQHRLCFKKIIVDPQSPFYRYVSTKRRSHVYEVASTESGFESNRNRTGIMIQNLHKRYVHPRSTLHLFKLLSEMWNSLLDSLFENLVASMPKRAKMVKKNRGRSTKY